MSQAISLGGRMLGQGFPALLVAELGINHGGSLDTALRMVRAAAASGADACKIQAFSATSFCTEEARYKGERQVEMFRRLELEVDAFSAIAAECKRCGVLFFGTPDSAQHARILLELGAPCLKVGSDDFVHLPLLRYLARQGVPLILSTGMADDDEITDALDAIHGCDVIMLHCVSEYPTPAHRANLQRMVRLRNTLRLVGYSDHTDGVEAAAGAAWLGARLIEKHFTLDRSSEGPDHAFSADPAQFAEMVRRVREAEMMLGSGRIEPESGELSMRVTARRSVVAAKSLSEGIRIDPDMLAFKRPGDGLPPRMADEIVGKRLTRSVAADEQLREGDWT